MTEQSLQEAIRALAAPLAASMGLYIWGLEYARGKRSLVRVYLESLHDAHEPGEGVSIDQCAKFSRNLALALDVEDLIPGAYTLEVSSPGLARPFFAARQMAGYIGQTVELVLREPLVTAFPGRKSFKGPLRAVEGEDVHVEIEAGAEGEHDVLQLRWQDLKKARLAPDFNIPSAPGKEKKKKGKKR